MTTFANIRDGEQFVWGDFLYMKISPAPVCQCHDCGIGINALIIKHKDGRQLMDRHGYPVLPWASHFCPEEKVEAR